jgi:serine/threonine protein kinase/WD40 repeat protein
MHIHHPPDWQGKMLGRYRLVRMQGQGGMGDVWQAEDIELHRQVVAKLLPSVMTKEIDYLRAFAQEARTAASLEHPHILPIHDFGEERIGDEISTYLIMPLITGGSLRDRMSATQGLLPLTESLHYLRQAAQAIDYAHTQKVLHRDIKPANMLLQQQWLFLADFGIAKLLVANASYNQTHAGAGTPDYMAPEQIHGHAEAASDGYSLAIIAYQLLTGQKPFTGNTPYETLMKQLQTMPPSPRQFNPQLPLAVEIVFLRGLAKQPEARFDSCTSFVNALEESLLPEKFRPSSSDPDATLLAPWSKRSIAKQPTQPIPLPTANAENADQAHSTPPQSTLLGADPTFVPTVQTIDQPASQVSLTHTPTEREVWPLPKHKIERRGLLIGSAAAIAALAAGSTCLAYYLHARQSALTSKPTPPTPGPHKLIAGIPVLRLTGHTKAVWNVAWHPGGSYLATSGDDAHVLLWDIQASLHKRTKTTQEISQPLHGWKFKNSFFDNTLSWSHDGRTLAVIGTIDGGDPLTTVVGGLYMITDQQSTPVLYLDKNFDMIEQPPYFMLAWSPVANLLATSIYPTMDTELWQYGNPNGPIRTIKGPPKPINEQDLTVERLEWSLDGTLLAGLRNDLNVVIWDVKTGNILQQSLTSPDRPSTANEVSRKSALAWSPRVRTQVASSDADIAIVWDALANKMLLQLSTDDPAAHATVNILLNGLAWSPNGRYLAGSYEHSHQISIWDMQNKTPRKTKEGIQLQDLLFGEQDGQFQLQNPAVQDPLVRDPDTTIIDLSWSPNGRYLATAFNDGTVIIWQVDGA